MLSDGARTETWNFRYRPTGTPRSAQSNLQRPRIHVSSSSAGNSDSFRVTVSIKATPSEPGELQQKAPNSASDSSKIPGRARSSLLIVPLSLPPSSQRAAWTGELPGPAQDTRSFHQILPISKKQGITSVGVFSGQGHSGSQNQEPTWRSHQHEGADSRGF